MLSLFPSLFDYSLLAITVLRVSLGLIFVWFAYVKIFREQIDRIAFFEKINLRPAIFFYSLVTGLELIAGVLLVIGLYAQAAALVAGVLMTIATLLKWRKSDALPRNTIEFYFLLAIVSFSLLFLGPGVLAFDLPL